VDIPEALPWAVVAAAKEEAKKPKEDAAKADAGQGIAASAEASAAPNGGSKPPPPPKGKESKAARWAHGNLLVPKERGGEFAFTCTSCRPFSGTTGVSPAAIYVAVLADGMKAAEEWLAGVIRARAIAAAPPLVVAALETILDDLVNEANQ
jgi:hypothetical protein